MSVSPVIGIDHIAVSTPDRYVCLTELAEARNVDPAKYLVGIGIKEAAVAMPNEDVVVLAANAGKRVLDEAGVDPGDVGLLVVGTESAVDKSKPTATHVHELLGVATTCRVYDILHACIGGTYGVLSALDWLHNEKNKYALVIATDIARYGKNNLGEPTQGAGAVAILLRRNPRLMALDELSTFSRQVWDFWKPMDEPYPVVDGMYSAQCYIEAASACFEGWGRINANHAYVYHIPYPKLVYQAHGRIARMIEGGVDWKKHFKTRVEPSCRLSARIGNIYTGSLWLSLVSQLEAWCDEPDLIRQASYLFSYGSGCGAALLEGRLQPSWRDMASMSDVASRLDRRKQLTIEQYEQSIIDYETNSSVENLPAPAGSFFELQSIEANKRQYAPVNRDD